MYQNAMDPPQLQGSDDGNPSHQSQLSRQSIRLHYHQQTTRQCGHRHHHSHLTVQRLLTPGHFPLIDSPYLLLLESLEPATVWSGVHTRAGNEPSAIFTIAEKAPCGNLL